jgi:hypothetical protein
MRSGGEVHCSWRRRADWLHLHLLHHSAVLRLARTMGQEGRGTSPWYTRDLDDVVAVNARKFVAKSARSLPYIPQRRA